MAARKKWRKAENLPWLVASCTVQLNLQVDVRKPEQWQPVKLLFVRGLNEEGKSCGKKSWALFLSTDP